VRVFTKLLPKLYKEFYVIILKIITKIVPGNIYF